MTVGPRSKIALDEPDTGRAPGFRSRESLQSPQAPPAASRGRNPIARPGLLVSLSLTVLFALACGTALAAPSTITSSRSDQALALLYQRNVFRDSEGYFWLFYFDGTDTYYMCSDDTSGTRWTSPPVLFNPGEVQTSVWVDANTVYVAFASNDDVLVRQGTISGGTVSWSPAYIAMDGNAAVRYSAATVCKDTDGYLWVSARSRTGATYSGCTARSAGPDDASSWLAPEYITPASSSADLYVLILPLANGDMYAVWSRNGLIEGKRYVAGSGWESATTSIANGFSGDTQMLFSAVTDSAGNVHLVYISDATDIRYARYDGSAWGAMHVLDGAGSSCPAISINPFTQRVYATWLLDRRQSCVSAVLPSSPGDWTTEYATPGKGRKFSLTSCYHSSASANWVMLQGPKAPYTIAIDGFGVGILSVLVSNPAFVFGTRPLDTWLAAESTLVTNDGTMTENVYARISPFVSGLYSWGVSPVSNGPDVCRAQWSTVSGAGPWNDVAAYDSEFLLATGLTPGASITFYFRIQTPTATSSYEQYATGITVRATQ